MFEGKFDYVVIPKCNHQPPKEFKEDSAYICTKCGMTIVTSIIYEPQKLTIK